MLSAISMSMKEILHRLNKICNERERVLVAIDGRGGAGKSSLAREIVENIEESAVVEFDWFHLPKSEIIDDARFDVDRFIMEVVSPFRSGASLISFCRYNWGYLAGKEEGLDSDPYTLSVAQVLVVEGCQTLDVKLSQCVDFSIWIDTDASESLRRGKRRDVEEYGLDPIRVNEAWQEWSEWEERLLQRDDRKARADMIV